MAISLNTAVPQRSLSGPLADKIGELLTRRFPRYEEEHRKDQEERQGKERQCRRDRMRRCDPADDRRREGSACAAERESGADRSPSDLCREQFGIVAEPAAVAAGNQEIQDQPYPEQAIRAVELSHDDEEDRSRQAEGRDDIAPAKQVAEPAAEVVGKNRTEHPDRQIARRSLKAEMLFISEVLRHPCRPADPREQIKEVQ